MLELRATNPGVLEIAADGRMTGIEWELSTILFAEQEEIEDMLSESLDKLRKLGIKATLDDVGQLYWDAVDDE